MDGKTLPMAYGGVVVNPKGMFLLRQPKGKMGGYTWTFPKSNATESETPEETAMKAVQEKVGVQAKIDYQLPRIYVGETTRNIYFLMSPVETNDRQPDSSANICWVTLAEAEERIKQTTSCIGQARDSRVLEDANALRTSLMYVQDFSRHYSFHEHNILTVAALRFDGYRYRDETQFDYKSAIQKFFTHDVLPDTPCDQMCLFFLLQRMLMKWGGEREPLNGKYWKLFRELFLKVAPIHIPSQYQDNVHGYIEEWQRDYLPHLKEIYALIYSIHKTTHYRKNE